MPDRTLPANAAYIEGSVGYIPLRSRDGSIRTWAMVDAEDFSRVSGYRWHLSSAGYATRSTRHPSVPGRQIKVLLSRYLLGLEHGNPLQADHISRNRLDNRRGNLRAVTAAQNAQNVGSSRGSSSRYRGVRWIAEDEKWRASVQCGGRYVSLGRFSSEDEAGLVVEAYRRKHVPFATD